MPVPGRHEGRSHRAAVCLIVAITLLLSATAAQAAPTPPAANSNTAPTTHRALPEQAREPQESSAPNSIIGLTDPGLIGNYQIENFSSFAEFSSPTQFDGGTFAGAHEVRIVGNSWLTWNPNVPGTKIMFATDGQLEITFNNLQKGVGAVAEPDNFDVFAISIEAFDASGASLGSFSRDIAGDAGAAFLGVLSDQFNIKRVVLTSDPNAGGFAFTDLDYGGTSGSKQWGWAYFDVNRDGWRNAEEAYSGLADAPLRIILHGETIKTVHTWPPEGYYELPWPVGGAYCLALDLPFQYEATTPTTRCTAAGEMAPDFGVLPYTGVIAGQVFRDRNGNGVREAGEEAIGGVTLELWPAAATAAALTTTSQADGSYSFPMLPAGAYSVKVATTNGPLAGLGPTGANPRTGIELTDGAQLSGVDFGYRAACASGRSIIAGRVWRDSDADQVEGAAEVGIANMRVCAEPFGWQGVLACSRTDTDGRFELCVVYARQLVTVGAGAGLTPTTPAFQFVDTPDAPYVHFGYR